MLKRIISAIASASLALCCLLLPAQGNAVSAPVAVRNAASVVPQDAPVWDGSVASSFAGGSGTEQDPYLISNGAELAYFRSLVNDSLLDTESLRFALSADIYLNDISDASSWDTQHAPANVWTPIGYNTYELAGGSDIIIKSDNAFKGVFDGRGHTVHGVYVNTPRNNDGFAPFQEGSGLFGASHHAIFKNLSIADSFISSEASSAAALVGWLYRGGSTAQLGYAISNCHIYPSCRVFGNQNVGGFIGSAISLQQGLIECLNEGQITGSNGVGGLIGLAPQFTSARASLTDCLNRGAVFASPALYGDSYSAGGLAGYYGGDAIRCANLGAVTSTRVAGGLFGDTAVGCVITDCYNAGSVSAQFEVGGLCGYTFQGCDFYNCYNAGAVSGDHSVGALTGSSESGVPARFLDCYYLDSSCANGDSFNGTALSGAQMMSAQSYSGYDFESVWTMEGDPDYPYAELTGLIGLGADAPLPGDLDENGAVGVSDAVLALRGAMELAQLSPAQALAGDVNGDGEVTVADAVMILRIAMGL